MKVVLLGAGGQLAQDLVRVTTGWDVVPLRRHELDVCGFAQVQKRFTEIKPEVVINTAAFHQVEECELRPEEAFRVNAVGAFNVARACEQIGAACVYLSTDYVFDGAKNDPYTEEDTPRPLNVYGVSKLSGEQLVRLFCPRHFIVRSSGLYGFAGASGKGGNFVKSMIHLARENKPIRVVNDQVLSPTYTKDLAQKIKELLTTQVYGLYHITSTGQCSWYDFAQQIFESLDLRPDLQPTTTLSFGLKACRPPYSVLGNRMLNLIGLNSMRSWQEALKSYLHQEERATCGHDP
ncbi:MAG: dTDP-4-dehydrorhamnose reductase [Gammaproteobacteria bacterium]